MDHYTLVDSLGSREFENYEARSESRNSFARMIYEDILEMVFSRNR